MTNPLEAGKQLHEALENGLDEFRTLAETFGYAQFEAHDLVRVYRVFAKVAEQEECPFEAVAQQASQVRFIKLSLIAQVLEKYPSDWEYWLDMAENLPLQDLRNPILQALQASQ